MSQPVAISTAEPINADTKNIAGVLRSENRAATMVSMTAPVP